MCLDAMRRHNRVARARRASRRPTPTGRLEILGYSGNMKIPLVKWSSAPLAARDCPKPGEAQRHTVIERRRDSFDARVVLTMTMTMIMIHWCWLHLGPSPRCGAVSRRSLSTVEEGSFLPFLWLEVQLSQSEAMHRSKSSGSYFGCPRFAGYRFELRCPRSASCGETTHHRLSSLSYPPTVTRPDTCILPATGPSRVVITAPSASFSIRRGLSQLGISFSSVSTGDSPIWKETFYRVQEQSYQVRPSTITTAK